MSREFGSYTSGYFHTQIRTAAEDCLGGGDKLTQLWGGVLRAFSEVAYAIASSEAGDSGPDFPIWRTITDMPGILAAIHDVQQYVEKYEKVAHLAVMAATRQGSGDSDGTTTQGD